MTSNDTGLVKKTEELPWHAAYPPPKTTAPVITRRSLLSWMLKGKIAGRDFVLIDLRRTDHMVCVVFRLCFLADDFALAHFAKAKKNQLRAQAKSLTVEGRNHPWINQPASSISLLDNSFSICPIFDSQS